MAENHEDRANTSPIQVVESPVCRHHWLLGDIREGTIPGICKRCGERRLFPAFEPETDDDWERRVSSTVRSDLQVLLAR